MLQNFKYIYKDDRLEKFHILGKSERSYKKLKRFRCRVQVTILLSY